MCQSKKRWTINFILFVLFLFLSVKDTFARDIFISPSGNDSNSGSEEQPLSTIQKGIDEANAGDNVILRAGTYYQKANFTKSGTASLPITLKAYVNETPVIDGTNVDYTDSNYGGAVKIYNVSYINVEGLKIINVYRPIPTDSSYTPPKPTIDGPAGIRISNSSYVNLKNNTTYSTTSSGIHAINSNHITVDGNKIGLAVKGGNQECLTLDSVTNFEIKNNIVYEGSNNHWGAEGIVVKMDSSSGTIHHNKVYGLPNEVAIYVGGYSGNTHDVEVFNNLVHNTGEGIVVSTEQGGTAENINIHHNIVYNVDGDGLYVSACCNQPETGKKNNISINNNTSYANGQNHGGGITNRSTTVTNLVIKNNIVSQNVGWQIRSLTQANITNNLIFGFRNYSNEVRGTNYIEDDPMFINTSIQDFHLQPTSPAIDSGLDLNYQSDYEGNQISSGLRPDIGAYEFQLAANPSPTPTISPSPTPTSNCLASNGDANKDGKINVFDYTMFLNEYLKDQTTYEADFNCDGKVNSLDYTVFLNHYLQ